MLRIRLICLLFVISPSFMLQAQDYSNRGLMTIKEQSENLRLTWIKAFEEAVQSKNFSTLQDIRQENEQYLEQHLRMTRRLYAEGDGRALLSAINNYMQIEQQFVRDAMVPAEKLTGGNQEGIDRIYQKISDFGQKEKIFDIDINNAIRVEGLNAGSSQTEETEMEQDEAASFEEARGSVMEGRRSRKKDALPHETRQGRKKQNKARVADDDDE